MKARKKLCSLVLTGTFFLTGCASQRYHTSEAQEALDLAKSSVLVAAPRFDWPLAGRVVAPYGSKEGGVSIKGILMEGVEGQPVRAASDGEVVYVDEGMRGYGKTLILEHGRGYSTVYARNAEILVVPGQAVKRGQTIAKIGIAGKGARPQSYFEIRRATKPEDPLQYLR